MRIHTLAHRNQPQLPSLHRDGRWKMESSETDRRLKVFERLQKVTEMSDGTPLPDTSRAYVSVGDLRVLISAVDEAKSQLAELLNLMKETASE